MSHECDRPVPDDARVVAPIDGARHRALLARTERLANTGSWALDPRTGEMQWTDNLFRVLGLEPDDVQPTLQLLVERSHPDDRERLRRAIESAIDGGELRGIEFRIAHPDGEVRDLRASWGFEDGAGSALLASFQDVTDQRRGERNAAAHVAVSQALGAWRTLGPGAQGLLGALARALDFAVAGLWLPQHDVLVVRTWWNEPWLDQAEFERISRELRLPRGIGLAGRAWERGRPVSLRQLKADNGFIRHEAADRAGLRGGLAFPAIADGEVLAVIELFAAGESELTERLTHSLAGIGQEVGAFLAGRRGQLKPSRLTVRQLEVLQLAAEGLSTQRIGEQLLLSSSTVKSHFEHIFRKLGVPDRVAAVAHALREGLIH